MPWEGPERRSVVKGTAGRCGRGPERHWVQTGWDSQTTKKTPPKELFASEALAFNKIVYGDQ